MINTNEFNIVYIIPNTSIRDRNVLNEYKDMFDLKQRNQRHSKYEDDKLFNPIIHKSRSKRYV